MDEANGRYVGLRGGQVISFGPDAIGLLVKAPIADAQIEAERPKTTPKVTGGTGVSAGGPANASSTTALVPNGGVSVTIPPTHFFGSVNVDAARISRDVGTIANEIIQHLASLPNSEVNVTVEIQARVPGGVPDNVVRTVSENCKTLKFKSQSFEKE